jgi:hypothetical protein
MLGISTLSVALTHAQINFQDGISSQPFARLDYAVAATAPTVEGNLLVLLVHPIDWTHPESGETTTVNVIEFDPQTQSIVAGYAAKLEADGELVSGTSLVYHPGSGQYLIYAPEQNQMLSYSFLPDTTRTEIVEKTRMVQIEVIPEPTPVPEEETVIEEAESVEPASEIAESEVQPASPDEASAPEEIIEEIETQSVESETAELKETVSEMAAASDMESAVETVEEASESEEPAPVEDPVENEETKSTVEDETPSIDEEQKMVAESEMEASVEETIAPVVPEEVQPVLKWVEETYEEEIEVIVSHKFGAPVDVYQLDDSGLSLIWGLTYSETSGSLFAFAPQSEGDGTTLVSLTLGSNAVLTADAVELGEIAGQPLSVFEDKVTGHLVIISSEGWTLYTNSGRKLRDISNTQAHAYVQVFEQPVKEGDSGDALFVGRMADEVLAFNWERSHEAFIHHVPGEYATIQAAVDAAATGHTVLLSPGVYEGSTIIAGKSVKLVSYYSVSKEPYFIENTVISGGAGIALSIDSSVPSPVEISGITLSGSNVAILSNGPIKCPTPGIG